MSNIVNMLNQILHLRSQETEKEREKRRRRLEGKLKVDYPRVTDSFDKYLQKHISDGLKTRNVRGLFKIPDSNIVVDVKERQEEPESESEEEEKKIQDEIPLLQKKQPEVIEDYERNRSVDYFIQQARLNPGKSIAVINKNTGTPRMVLKSDESGTKIYSGTLSMFPNYYNEDKGFLRDKVDIAYESRFPMKGFTKKDLPRDTKMFTTTYYSDDDDDQDKGGQKIQMKKIKEEEDDEEEEKSNIPYMEIPKNNQDDDEDKGGQAIKQLGKLIDDEDDDARSFKSYKSAKSKSSNDYKLEIAKLNEENKKLVERLKAIPELEENIGELQDQLKDIQEEVEYLRDIEKSAKKDLNDLKEEYENQRDELQRSEISKIELKKQLYEAEEKYKSDLEELIIKYDEAEQETKDDIASKREEYEKMKRKYEDLLERSKEKDHEIRGLYTSVEEGNNAINQLQDELNTYKKKYHDLEVKRNQEQHSLNQLLQHQGGNKSEISQLNQIIQQLEYEKQNYLNLINQKEQELENVKTYAETEYGKLKTEKEDIKNEYENLVKYEMNQERFRQRLSEISSEQDRKINEQEELIKRLTDQLAIYQKEIPIVSKDRTSKMEEEIKIEAEPRQGLKTRSQGPAETGMEIVEEIFDPQGNLIWKGMRFELADKEYNAADFVINLIKQNKSNEIKNFKMAYENRQKVLGDTSTYDSKKYVSKAIEILESQFDHNKEKIALVMDYIIKHNEKNLLSDFKKKYMSDYARYIKKV